MSKVASRYLEVDPWLVVEKGFHAPQGEVSESLFSLGNEFMGVRGYFEEGYSGKSLPGSYFNGIYEYAPAAVDQGFVGMVSQTHFMINSLDWLYTRIKLDGEQLDCATSRIGSFERTLDMQAGTLTRRLVWTTRKGRKLRLTFQRFVSMATANLGCQRIVAEPLNFSGVLELTLGLDFRPLHQMAGKNFWTEIRKGAQDGLLGILAHTETSGQRVFSSCAVKTSAPHKRTRLESDKFIGSRISLPLKQGIPCTIDKIAVNAVEKNRKTSDALVWSAGMRLAGKLAPVSYDAALARHAAYWSNTWKTGDVTIEGDAENQQGIRFSIFHLHQAYHGIDPRLNITAKGLTGEMYWGWTWWDTETYCLPFYLFTNPRAARNLLGYRHSTLPGAIKRAGQLDCEGARYPMGTIDGAEACVTWQHGDLEIHVSAAVAYGIWHYLRITGDKAFLYTQGIEMLLQISRYYASRGQWAQVTGDFGFWGVMGADEFHMMVHNNCYTNVMARKAFEYTLQVVEEMRAEAPEKLMAVVRKVKLRPGELPDWKLKASRMRVPRDARSGIYEQHDGYFNLPHVDVAAIPPEQFPLYKHWAYVRIFRNDMIKQPDVLLLHFFFSHEYSLANKRANFEYYEPRCSHESSLSPAVHSILAAELGKSEQAYNFMRHAFRLDLDNYNRNTHEGVHTTSMAAAWMNVVYGYGGLRSDGRLLSFKPSLPKTWKSFSFKIAYRGSLLKVTIDKKQALFSVIEGPAVPLLVYGKKRLIGNTEAKIALR